MWAQHGVLVICEFEIDLAAFALHHHLQNVAILQRPRSARASDELDHSLVGGEAGLARQWRTHAVVIPEDDEPEPLVETKRHQNAILARLWRAELHGLGDLAVIDPPATRAEAVVAIDGFNLAHGKEHPALCAGLTVRGKRGFAALSSDRHGRIVGEIKTNIVWIIRV